MAQHEFAGLGLNCGTGGVGSRAVEVLLGTVGILTRIGAVMINHGCALDDRNHGRVVHGVAAVGVTASGIGRFGEALMRYDGAVLLGEITSLLDAVVVPLGHSVEIGRSTVQMVR